MLTTQYQLRDFQHPHGDAKDKLTAVAQTVSGTTTQSTYTYNADGIRTSQTLDGTETKYVVDSHRDYAQVLMELDSSDTVQVQYTYGDDLISQKRGTEARFYHYDGLGSTRALSDATGTITDLYNYEAFGELLNSTGATDNSYLYAGEQYDSGLGQYYLRARYYDQGVGRFTQQDTWMGNNHDPITLHKYLYANADPGNMIDPTGNFSLGSVSVGINIQGILSTLNIASTALDIFSLASGEGEVSARQLGTSVLLSMLPAGSVAKLFRKTCKKNSFVAGTLVQLSGEVKNIEDVKIGDLVLSYNEQTGEQEYNKAIHLIVGNQEYIIVRLILENGDVIESTSEHPFYIDGEWVAAIDINVNDSVLSKNGNLIRILQVDSQTKAEKVYNLTVTGEHNYYVGITPVLVHNAAPWCSILNAAGKVDRSINIDSTKLQSKWKHAKDFGVHGNFNKNSGKSFEEALKNHMKGPNTIPIAGLYKRGNIDVIHFVDPKTGLNVMKDLNGKFVSGWKLNPAQLRHVLEKGVLGGG